jgi:hypothetical protein
VEEIGVGCAEGVTLCDTFVQLRDSKEEDVAYSSMKLVRRILGTKVTPDLGHNVVYDQESGLVVEGRGRSGLPKGVFPSSDANGSNIVAYTPFEICTFGKVDVLDSTGSYARSTMISGMLVETVPCSVIEPGVSRLIDRTDLECETRKRSVWIVRDEDAAEWAIPHPIVFGVLLQASQTAEGFNTANLTSTRSDVASAFER